jgi:hypothetical protein
MAGNKNDRNPYKWVGGQRYDRDPFIYYSFSVTQFPPTDGAIKFHDPADGMPSLRPRTPSPCGTCSRNRVDRVVRCDRRECRSVRQNPHPNRSSLRTGIKAPP